MSGCDTLQGGAGPYIYGVNGTGGSCYTLGTSTRCFGGSGGSIRGTGINGGGDGVYIDFIASMSNAVNMNGKPNTGGGGGGGLESALTETITQDTNFSSRSVLSLNFNQSYTSSFNQSVTPGSGGSGIAIVSYLSAEECPSDLPFYNFDLLSPVCTTCLQYDSKTPYFDASSGLCTACPANNYYDPSTKTCVSACPTPMSPNPNFSNVCAIPPLTCQGGRPYFNGYECASSQVNFSTQGGGTGGNSIVNNGAYIIHTFTTSGDFTGPVIPNVVGDVLIVGGGGGGGTYSIESTINPSSAGGGGGGDVQYLQGISFGTQSWRVTIGQGGLPNQNGGDTSFGTYVAAGGGAGSAYPEIVDASSGASGGGGSGRGDPGNHTAGFSGGAGEFISGTGAAGGGGGGKNSQGMDGHINQGGNGGDGITNSITGTSTVYGGGGGGSAVTVNRTYVAGGVGGVGGVGGGGGGAGSVVYNETGYQKTNMVRGENGIPGTGGGGGGGASVASRGSGVYVGNPVTTPGSRGGSGIVIIRYSTTYLCAEPLPNFNPGLKICTACGDVNPFWNGTACAKCPGAKPYWNGIACVVTCPTVLPYPDKNNICQLPCSPASPNWDGTQCTLVCPDTKPIADNGRCTLCPSATPKWDPVAKICRSTCLEGVDATGTICTPCYKLDIAKPYWNGTRCDPCPAATPAWTGPGTACQACQLATPIWDAAASQCKTCYSINQYRPFYNQAPASYLSSSSLRCQPCPVVSTPLWDNTLKACQICPTSTPYWNDTTPACEVCPAARPYWNSRVCTLPSNVITVPLTTTTTANVTAAATTTFGTSFPWKAFDGSSTTSWQSATSYAVSGGLYSGTKSTRDLNDTLWRGEFLQIEFPYSYIISSYMLKTNVLRRWVVLGSSDGFKWELLDNKSTASTTNFNQTFYITPPISNAYPLFRLVATMSGAAAVSIYEWSIQTANAAVTSDVVESKSALTVISSIVEGCNSISCVLDKSAVADITDIVYGNYPPTQVENDRLNDKAQEALSNCSSNVDCGFVQFDFLSNVSKFSTSAPYTVNTMMTTGTDVGLFQKKYGVTPPPRLRSPPGFEYSYYYIEGVRLGSNLTATIDVCGQACSKNASCKGFNFHYISSNCEFYSSVSSSDKYSPDKGSFGRDSRIMTGEQNTNRLPYTNLDESGSTCQTRTACNTDVSSLIGQLGSTVQSFSTAELDSCNYCPVRSVAKQGSVYTITNEADIASNTAATADVQSKMTFSNVNTTTHVQIGRGNYVIRPYVEPGTTATVNIQTGGNGAVQIWMGSEPFAAGFAPKNCETVYDPGPPAMAFSYFKPMYQMGTTVRNGRTGEICTTTAKGTYTHQTCSGSCGTGTDMDPGTRDVSDPIANYSAGNPDLLLWELTPVDWVTNGYYIRSSGSEKRTTGIGPKYVKTDAVTMSGKFWKPANLRAQPYLKWGSYIGKYTDIGNATDDGADFERLASTFAEGVVTGATIGFVSVDLVDKNNPNNIFFNSFPPQFQTMAYPTHTLYSQLQTLPSQQPGGSKFDDTEYIFVIEPV